MVTAGHIRPWRTAAGVVWLTALAAGCAQNKLTVRVDRVLVEGESGARSQLQESSPLGRAVSGTVHALTRLIDYLGEARTILDRAGGADANLRAFLEPYVGDLAEAENALRRELDAMHEFLQARDAVGLGPRIRLRLLAAQIVLWDIHQRIGNTLDNLAKEASELTDALAAVTSKEVRGQIEAEIAAARPKLEASARISLSASESISRIGFGGFSTVGVFEINAADPIYQTILSRSPARLSRDPFTMATASIDGDSSIMIVMESPGQVRIYQIQNDPTQLVRNVAMLIQKATGAANKILASMLTP